MREMVRQHFGAEKEFLGNVATEIGNEYEDDALAAVERKLEGIIESVGLIVSDKFAWASCSPDGRISKETGVEVKVPYRKEISEVVKDPGYADQCFWSMFVTGSSFWWLAAYDRNSGAVDMVKFDKAGLAEWEANNFETIVSFREEYEAIIEDPQKAEPYLEPLVVDQSGREWLEAAGIYLEAKAEEAQAKARAETAKNLLTELSGGKKSKGGGVLLIPGRRKTTDYSRIVKELGVNVEDYQKEGNVFFTVKASK